MVEEESTVSVIDYLEIAWRRRWVIIVPFLIVMSITIAISYALPKIYKARTTILVIPQKVPDSFIKPTVTMNPSEYLNVISQEIMSRTRLEKIIHELSLFPELINKVPMENLVATMRNNIELDVRSNRNRSVSSFTISYLGKDPQTITLTTNRLASLFIEENLKSREQQAKKTTEFLSNELKKLKGTLGEQEKVISEFKQRYLGSLPEQRDANLRMLDQLILQRQRITDELNDTENRKILIQQQLLQSDNLPLSPIGEEPGRFSVGSLKSRINETKRRITKLQNRYTDNHPDVISAKAELQKLLLQSNSVNENIETQKEAVPSSGNEIDRQLLAFDLEIKTLKNEDRTIKEKIAKYQSRVEMAPKLEQQLASLTRDYKNTKTAYAELMKKRLEAEQAEKLEINQQGEQFKVLDPAKVPLKPFKPDRLKILLMGFILSLGLGGGLVFLLEYFDQSFYSVKDLESYLELPVLASIPLVPTKNYEKALHKIMSVLL